MLRHVPTFLTMNFVLHTRDKSRFELVQIEIKPDW